MRHSAKHLDDFDWLDDIETYAKDVPWRYAQVLIDEVRQTRDDVDYWHERSKSQRWFRRIRLPWRTP